MIRHTPQQGFRRHAMFTHGLMILGWLSLSLGVIASEPVGGITAKPQDGFNLLVREFASPTHVVLTLATPSHGWFAGTFTNLPLGQPVTFGFSLDGQDDLEPANVSKWKGLRPVTTYTDPTLYDSYIGYIKGADGRWRANDLFRRGQAADAGDGLVPVQQVIPPDLATQFLSNDGAAWYPWREMTAAHALTGVNIFRMTETFTQPTATLAMRVPYTYQYLQSFLGRLKAAQFPGVSLDLLGQTPGGHTLTVIRLEPLDPAAAPADRPTILAYAREHATEHDSSWVVEGMLYWLLSDDPAARSARQQYDWLLIPLLDPDRAAQARFTNADLFLAVPPIRPEAVAYATYLVNWVDAGHRLDLAINLHNVECTEGPHLFSPLINKLRQPAVARWHQRLYAAVEDAGFTTGTPSWCRVGMQRGRLAGWCFHAFRTADLAYEVNSRVPGDTLEPPQLRQLGQLLAQQSAAWLSSEDFTPIRQEIIERLTVRSTERTAWLAARGRTLETRNTVDVLQWGY